MSPADRPWRVDIDDRQEVSILSAAGEYLCCRVPDGPHSYMDETTSSNDFGPTEANARLICRCVNAHEDLVEAVSYLLGVLQDLGVTNPEYQKEMIFAKNALRKGLAE